MTNRTRIPAAVLAAAFLVSLPALAQDKAPEMSAKEKAQMAAMMKASTPGAQHKQLEGFVGSWDAKVKMWAKPGAPPTESTGSSEAKMVLGGRFVEESFNGNFMGQPFSGMGITGYDNVTKKYVGTWADTMSTGVMMSKGTADASGKVITMTSSMPDPETGKMMPIKETMHITDADHHTFEMWSPDESGKMFKMMEITYSRKK